MCGICGVFARNVGLDGGETASVIGAMSRAMIRRGPDDGGYWTDNERCAFGFRRLSILDLSPAGHQPMLTADGRYALVLNGEVYNFAELRRRLEARGVRFRSSGDAEVVLYALATWGVGALVQFNGMFALAFYDSHTRTLLLARDHAGIKPLYYFVAEQGLVFASQYSQLLGHPWAQQLGASADALSLYIRFGYVPAPYALAERTHSLDAGAWMMVDAEGGITRGYHYEFPRFTAPTLHGVEAVDALEDALSAAVARHLVSDVPVGVFLSGGIDSPLVAAEARRHLSGELPAFTIGVLDRDLDESEDARRYAHELGLTHVVWQVDPRAAIERLDQVVDACSEPTADFSIIPTLMVSELARTRVKVALSGDGGDELFWGYPGRFGSAIEQARYFARPRLTRVGDIAARRYLGRGRATRDVLWPTIGRLYQKKHTIMAERDLAAAFPALLPVPTDVPLFEFDSSDADETAQWVRWNEFRLHLTRVLLKVDRASMHHSLEVRVPLLDKDVIAVATRVDWRTCLSLEERVGKEPLRALLRRRVHHQTHVKKGFTVPMHEWLAGPLQPLLQERALSRKQFLGLEVNRRHLEQMNRRLIDGDRSVAWGLWLLLSLGLWEDRHWNTRLAREAA